MSLVLMPVSIAGLRDRLLLPDEARIVSACTVQHLGPTIREADLLMLVVDMPAPPEGAASVEAVYKHSGHRDPVEFEGLVWRDADGTEIKTEACE